MEFLRLFLRRYSRETSGRVAKCRLFSKVTTWREITSLVNLAGWKRSPSSQGEKTTNWKCSFELNLLRRITTAKFITVYKILSHQKKKNRTFYKGFKQPLKRKQSSQIKIRRPGWLYGKPAFFGSTHCLQYIPTLMTTSHQHILTQKKFSFKIFNKTNLTKEKGGVWERFAVTLSVNN